MENIDSLVLNLRGHQNAHKKLNDDEIVNRYLEGELSTSIAKDANISCRSVRRIINKYGFQTRSVGQPRKHMVNESFFDEWSEDMAYVLGFIMADGCISGNTFSISQKEKYILEKIKNKMDYTGDVKIVVNNKTSYIYNLIVNSKHMVQVLSKKYNITENKSLTLKPPENIPSVYLPHLIRGFFDGDGHVSPNSCTLQIVTASIDIAKWLSSIFIAQRLNLNIRLQKNGDNIIYRVTVTGKDDVKRFGRWIYPAKDVICLERKRKIIEQTR